MCGKLLVEVNEMTVQILRELDQGTCPMNWRFFTLLWKLQPPGTGALFYVQGG